MKGAVLLDLHRAALVSFIKFVSVDHGAGCDVRLPRHQRCETGFCVSKMRIVEELADLPGMDLLMGLGADGDEVLFCIISHVAPQLDVVNVQIRLAAAVLAAPAGPAQHLLASLLVSWTRDDHAISARRPVRNWCFCSPGKNLYRRDTDLSRTSESP